MKLTLKKDTVSKMVEIFIQDSSSTVGAGLGGLVFNSAGLTAYYYRSGAAAPATAITLVTATVGTFTSSGFIVVDATNMPGVYQLHLPNAAIATGANTVIVMLRGATNMAPLVLEIQLVDFDPNDSVRLGLTALPNAAAAAANGLVTFGSGSGQLNVDGSGRAPADVKLWLATPPNALVTGRVDSSVGAMAANVLTATAINADAITDAKVASDVTIASVTGSVGSVAGAVGSVTAVSAGAITAASFAANAIDATAIANGAIDAATFANNAITAAVIADGAIDAATFAANAITATVIADGAIDAATFAAGAITATVVADGTIDAATFAAGAINLAALASDFSPSLQSGTAQSGAATTITLAAGASATDSLYIGNTIKIYGGTGVGQTRTIIAYNGTTKVATVDFAWVTNPTSSSTYSVISGDNQKLDANLQVTVGTLGTGSIAAATFAANAIDAAAIANGAIDAATFAAGAINAAAIASAAITNAKFAAGAIDAAAVDTTAGTKILAHLSGTTTATGTTTTLVDATNLTQTVTDYWVGLMVYITSGSCAGQIATISGFNTSTDTLTVRPPFTAAIASGVTYSIMRSNRDESLSTSAGAVKPAVGSYLDQLMNKNSSQTYDPTTDSLEANIDGSVTLAQLVNATWDQAETLVTAAGSIGLKIKTAVPNKISKNVAFNNFEFMMVDSTDHVTGKTGLTVSTKTESIDGAAFAALSGTVAEVGNGIYKISLTAAELNGDDITLRFAATGADDTLITLVTQPA